MWTKFFLFVLIVLVFYYLNRFIHKILARSGTMKKVPARRIFYLQKFVTFLSFVGIVVAVSLLFSIDYKGLFVFASSIVAVVGVAFFAQWSILSSITSSVIIFFSFPARIGDKVRVLDGDNTVEGEITDISLYHVEIKDSEDNLILYPNNLVVQKPIIRLK